MPPESDPTLGPLANKLRGLRYLKLRPDGEQYDISEIAEEVSRLYVEDKIVATRTELDDDGAPIDEINAAVDAVRNERPLLNRPYMSELLGGKRRNPTKNILEYLALFFGVNPAYFFEGRDRTDETAAAEDEIEMMVAMAQLYRRLKQGADPKKAKELLTAYMRGASELDPKTVTGMLHMQLAAVQHAKEPPA